jgi:H+/Cl- antiporter ClcA
MLKIGERLSERLRIWSPLKGVIGGIVLVGLVYLFSARYLGLGLETVEAGLRGEVTDWYAFLVKPLFTSITLSFGGSGGIVTPIFFIGTTAGAFLAHIFHLNIATFAAIGFVSVLAGAANTPIAASIMAVELFGPTIAPYATVACVISFLITGHRSVYPSQVISMTKSPSLRVEIGKELEKARTTVQLRDKSLTKGILKLLKRIEDIVDRHYK